MSNIRMIAKFGIDFDWSWLAGHDSYEEIYRTGDSSAEEIIAAWPEIETRIKRKVREVVYGITQDPEGYIEDIVRECRLGIMKKSVQNLARKKNDDIQKELTEYRDKNTELMKEIARLKCEFEGARKVTDDVSHVLAGLEPRRDKHE